MSGKMTDTTTLSSTNNLIVAVTQQQLVAITQQIKKTLSIHNNANHSPQTVIKTPNDLLSSMSNVELEMRAGTVYDAKTFVSGIPTSSISDDDNIIKTWASMDQHLANLSSALNNYCDNDGPFIARSQCWSIVTSIMDYNYFLANHNDEIKGKLRTSRRHYDSLWHVNLKKIQHYYDNNDNQTTSLSLKPLYDFLGIHHDDIIVATRRCAMESQMDARAAIIIPHKQLMSGESSIAGQTVEKRVMTFVNLMRTPLWQQFAHCDLRISLSSETSCIINFVPNRLIAAQVEEMKRQQQLVSINNDTITTPVNIDNSPKGKRKKEMIAAGVRKTAIVKKTSSSPNHYIDPQLSQPRAHVAIKTNSRETRLRLRKSWLLGELYSVNLSTKSMDEKDNLHHSVVRPAWVVELTLAWHGRDDAECAKKAITFYNWIRTENWICPNTSILLSALKEYVEKEQGSLTNLTIHPTTVMAPDMLIWCGPNVELEVECVDVSFCNALDDMWPGQLNNTIAKGIGIITVLNTLGRQRPLNTSLNNDSIFTLL